MVGRMARSCLQTVLKLVNSLIGLAGMGMILFSLWMIRGWFKQFGGSDSNPPWYAFLLHFINDFFFLVFLDIFGAELSAETSNFVVNSQIYQ